MAEQLHHRVVICGMKPSWKSRAQHWVQVLSNIFVNDLDDGRAHPQQCADDTNVVGVADGPGS